MPLHLFQAFGVELEYMIVDCETLDVRPVADALFQAAGCPPEGDDAGDFEDAANDITWSNELAAHLVEIKTSGPVPTLAGLAARFDASLIKVQSLLEGVGGRAGASGCRLMPGAMHPWMDPMKEMRLWPHGYSDVYAKFNEVFDCRGHGWANLQSVHLNLPFHGDDEFGRLHAAIRLVLPILPALAASSPVMDGRLTGVADNRLAVYRTNARRVPIVSGRVIPERAFTRDEYETRILGEIYRQMEPLDPEGILRHEWINSRGAIARFDRSAIEIRVMDVQECPVMDVALVAAVAGLVQDLVEERWCSYEQQKRWEVEPLLHILEGTISRAEQSTIENPDYLRLFGDGRGESTAGSLWRRIIDAMLASGRLSPEFEPALRIMLNRGTLSSRLTRAIGRAPARADLARTYARLCDSLPAQSRLSWPFAE